MDLTDALPPDAVPAAAGPEAAVRDALAAVEACLRRAALLALADWEAVGVPAPELFQALAALQRPSFGAWNGLLGALRGARKSLLQSGRADQRERLGAARDLHAVLAALDRKLDAGQAAALGPLAALGGTRLAAGAPLRQAAALAVTLRNRVAHDAPRDPAWWTAAADALRPLLALIEPSLLPVPPAGGRSPWLVARDGGTWVFNGLTREQAAILLAPDGRSRTDEVVGREVVLAFQRLLGKADVHERDFRRLLGRLAPEETKGVLLGDYLVGRPVGAGGFATVHVARQLSTGRRVAVKVLRDGATPEVRERFQREAAYVSRISHPNVVGVLGFGEEPWRAPRAFSLADEPWFAEFARGAAVRTYIALEWVAGRTLDEVFRAGPAARPETRTIVEWFADAAAALAAVHAAGLVHRDVKPGNLMVTEDGVVRLMDFGVARSQDEARTLHTTTGATLGTPAYMSPEQVRAADAETEVGPASDVYSLSATFYELLIGQRLFDHDQESPETVRTRKLRGQEPAQLRRMRGRLPWELVTLLLGGLQVEPADRPRSAAALEQDLRAFLADRPIAYRRPSLARRARLGYRRHRAIANLVAAFLLLVLAGVALYVRDVGAQRDIAEAERASALQRSAALLREGAREALTREDLPGARARLRSALEVEDATLARSIWWQVERTPLLFRGVTGDLVYAVAWSPDGRQLASAGAEGYVRIWDPETGAARALRGSGEENWALDWSPDGRRVAAGRVDGQVTLWDPATRRIRERFAVYDNRLRALVFSPDGARFATLAPPSQLLLTDARSGALLRSLELPAPSPSVHVVEFTPDGTQVLTTHSDGTVRFWDAATGAEVRRIEGPAEWPLDFALTPDGRTLLTSSREGALRVWDVVSGRVRATLPTPSGGARVAFSPDGRLAALGGEDGSVGFVELAGGRQRARHEGHSYGVQDMRFRPDGRALATASFDRTVRVWRTPDHGFRADASHDREVVSADFSPDGRTLATGAWDGRALLWDLASGRATVLAEHPDAVRMVTFSPDGMLLATACNDRIVRLWDVGTGTARQTLIGHTHMAWGVAFSADGRTLATSSYDRTLRLWDVASGAALRTIPMGADAREVVLAPDGSFVAAAGNDGNVWIFRPADGVHLHTLRGLTGTLYRLALSPDGTRLASAGGDGRVAVWDAASGRPLSIFGAEAHGGLRFLPDGERLVVGGADGTVNVFDAGSGALLQRLHRALGPVEALDVSADGRRVVAVADDLGVRVWELPTGRGLWRAPLLVPGDPPRLLTARGLLDLPADGRVATARHPLPAHGPAAALLAVADRTARRARLSPDGQHVTLATWDGRAELWQVPTGVRRAALPAEGLRDVLPLPDGFAVLTDGGVALHRCPAGTEGCAPRPVTVPGATAVLPTATGEVLVAVGDELRTLSIDGEPRNTTRCEDDVTALATRGDEVLVGYADGLLERRLPAPDGRVRGELERAATAPVGEIAEGPPGTVAAGFANGVVALWSLEDGRVLARTKLNGPVLHLAFLGTTLHAVTEAGDFEAWDLSAYVRPYCDVLRDVWANVPVVWEGGAVVRRAPPTDHVCAARPGAP